MSPIEDIKSKIIAYKKRYYLNRLFKGLIICFAVIMGIFIASTVVEYQIRLGTAGRGFLFYSLLLSVLALITTMVLLPLKNYIFADQSLSDKDAASQIGNYFPEVQDKLLNILQLSSTTTTADNELIKASIENKTDQIKIVSFPEAVDISQNQRYLKYPLILILLILMVLWLNPTIITSSTKRIIDYNTAYVPPAPFVFIPSANEYTTYRNESVNVEVTLKGELIPNNVALVIGNDRLPMKKLDNARFVFTLNSLKEDVSIRFSAAGYNSERLSIKVIDKPLLSFMKITAKYPGYLNRAEEVFEGNGNLEVPEGTNLTWKINTRYVDSAKISLESNNKVASMSYETNGQYQYAKTILSDIDYAIILSNTKSDEREKLSFQINVIKDQPPTITMDTYKDTIFFDKIYLGGIIGDDYGLRKLELLYKTSETNESYRSIPISVSKSKKQNFGYTWDLSSLNIDKGTALTFYMRVWDNDGVNGSKSTQTSVLNINLPDKKELDAKISQSEKQAQDELNETLDQSKVLQEDIKEISQSLKGKKEPDWKDKKDIEKLLQKKKDFEKEVEQLKEKQKLLQEQQKKFGTQNEKVMKKSEELQKLMDEILDEETKQLYEELQKLLQQKSKSEDYQDVLDQLENKEKNFEREIEKAIEMFKQMKLEMKLDDLTEKLDQLAKEQEALSRKTEDKKTDLEDIKKEQNNINKEFDEVKKEINELDSLNDQLKSPNEMEEFNKETDEIDQAIEKSNQNLEDNKRSKASDAQKKASEEMKKLQQKMQEMASKMESEMNEENAENLKQILDNLIKASFEQERIMNEFSKVRQTDPRFVSLSQDQLKLQRDTKIILDSLYALSQRVEQLSTFILREASAVENNMERSIKSIRDRKKEMASARQQLAFTSFNNLALMLDNVLKNMQSQMAGSASQNKKGKKKPQPSPSLSELQKQLNQRIDQVRKSGAQGRKLSEELAKLAAEQEGIRRKLKEMEKYLDGEGDKEDGKPGGKSGNQLNELKKQMEQTELDLVKKELSSEMIERQKQIMTKLLEAENALREKELDKEREGQQPKNVPTSVPPEFQEYLKKKQKEVELLKTIPLKLNSFYKKEVDAYFERLEQ